MLVNTIDMTKCPGFEVFKTKCAIDVKGDKVYAVYHAGVFVTDCRNSTFQMLMDGKKYKDFQDCRIKFRDLVVGKNDDFYIMGLNGDAFEDSDLWHFTKKRKKG